MLKNNVWPRTEIMSHRDSETMRITVIITTAITSTTAAPTTVPTTSPLVVTLIGNSGTQIPGEAYTLTCLATGGGTTAPTYRWFRDGSLISGQTSATLSFSPLRETDSGAFICEAAKNFVSQLSEAIMIG